MDLSTTYLGLPLAHPFVVGASPLSDTLDGVKRLEDAGAAAIVLRSIFEEQITMAETGRIHGMDPHEAAFAGVLSAFPGDAGYVFSPDAYLEHVRQVKAAITIPVVASLNGTTSAPWFVFAALMEQAGADALEINMYDVVTQPDVSGVAIERRICEVVGELGRSLAIPVAAKLSPFFTALGNLAHELDGAGVDGLVLFNRFYQPDIDIETLTPVPRVTLSTSDELLLRVRWMAILHGRVRASLAVAGGVASPADGVKAVVAGADVVQLVSALLRHGPSHLGAMRAGLIQWLDTRHMTSVSEARGLVSLARLQDPSAFERGTYIRMLQSYAGPELA